MHAFLLEDMLADTCSLLPIKSPLSSVAMADVFHESAVLVIKPVYAHFTYYGVIVSNYKICKLI